MTPSRKRRLAKIEAAQAALLATTRLLWTNAGFGPSYANAMAARVNYLSRLARKAP